MRRAVGAQGVGALLRRREQEQVRRAAATRPRPGLVEQGLERPGGGGGHLVMTARDTAGRAAGR